MQHFNKPVAAVCLAVASAFVHAQQATWDFDIPAQPASQVLDALSRQTGLAPFFADGAVKGVQSPGVKGKLTLREALDKALAGTGLAYQFTAEKAVAIKAAAGTAGIKALPTLVITAEKENSYKSPTATVASKLPASPREIPYSVSVLTRQQMDEQNMMTIWDAMSQMTGTQAIWNDTDQGQFHARGGAMNIQYDGMPSLYPLSGSQQFDLAMYERVEVQRGPAGVLQGSGFFSGTVNLVRKAPKREFEAHLQGSLGSWDNKRIEADVTGPITEDGRIRGRFVASWDDKDWFVDRMHNDKWLAYGVVEADVLPSTTLRLSAAAQRSDTDVGYSGLPTYTDGRLIDLPRSFNPNPDWNKYQWEHEEFAGELEHRFAGGWHAKVRASRRESGFFFKDGYLTTGIDPTTMTGDYLRRKADWDYTSRDFDAYVGGPFELFGRTHDLVFGANHSTYLSKGKSVTSSHIASLRVNGVVLNDPPNVPDFDADYRTGSESETTQYGVYGQLRARVLDPLAVVLGGRYTNYDARSRTVSPAAVPTAWSQGAKENGVFTPSAGIVFDVTKAVSLYASYADIFVPQTSKKADGSVLKPRVGEQYEIGAKGDFFDGKLGATLAAFQITDTNRAFSDPANPGFFLPLGEVESKGWELEFVGSPLRNWDLSAGYTNLRTEQTKTSTASSLGAPISYWYPRHQLKLWSNWRFGAGPLQGVSLGFGMTGMSRTASGASTPTVRAREQSGYAVFNASIGYRIDKTYSLNLAINNLFDRGYFTRVQGTNTYMSYGEPRNWLLTFRAGF
ncbi:MAG: TonB-dependent siderophore receptor [Rhodocyclaceae bacterium]|nr:TonB-dependent siderophore receptor [Rhodocyclaceae bacterium]